MLEVRVDGMDGFIDRLSQFTSTVQKRVVSTAARKAMEPVKNLAKSNARALKIDDPATPSNIIENIVNKKASKKAMRYAGVRDADHVQQVGVLGGAKDPETDDPLATFHWRFLEFGTSTIAARPFMRKALAQNTQRTTDIFAAEMRKGMDRAAARAARGTGAKK
jgi:HK97 gp10 family phage protein